MRALFATAIALLACGVASGAEAGERIRDFQVSVGLSEDGSFDVVENIAYDFGAEKRHGIYRDIPVRYGRGHTPDYRIDLSVVSVEDGSGNERPYRVSSEGRNRRVRVGSADRKVTGRQLYRITYRVRRGILWFDEHDEFYWNATGLDWKVPIDSAGVAVALPEAQEVGALRSTCFTGSRGSVESACKTEASGNGLRTEATRGLRPGEGLTVVLGLPKGLLAEPSDLAKWLDRARDYVSAATLLPLLVLVAMATRWWRHGRDPSGPVAIPVRYEPPEGMTPAELGTVLDEEVDLPDITATILDLAVRGYVEIEELETKTFLFLTNTDYRLRRVKPDDDGLKPFESELLSGLLGSANAVKFSDLKNEFYKQLPDIRKALYTEVSSTQGYFPTAPDRVRTLYRGLAFGTLVIGEALAIFRSDFVLMASVAVSALIVAVVGPHMPRKTRKGRRAKQHIQGFREFVERVEADRLERLGLRNITQFERLLPYAFVLGVADQWAEAFADLYREPPSWYHSNRGDRFRPRAFIEDVGRSLDSAGSAMGSRPSSSGGSGGSGFGGGGSSGGGFGGGGGGSW